MEKNTDTIEGFRDLTTTDIQEIDDLSPSAQMAIDAGMDVARGKIVGWHRKKLRCKKTTMQQNEGLDTTAKG